MLEGILYILSLAHEKLCFLSPIVRNDESRFQADVNPPVKLTADQLLSEAMLSSRSRPHPTLFPFAIILPVEQRYRIGSAITLTSILTVLLLLEGCSSKPPLSGVHFPITSGFHTLLPTEQKRILIWGDPLLNHLAEEWLRSHHYSHILLPHLDSLAIPPALRTASDRQAALTLATELQAEFVLILEREELKEGALIDPHCGSFFNINVDVRGLSVERRETVLRGSAHYPQCVERSDKTFQNLTCQALATAWGFRPSGQLEIPSTLACTAGQTTPTLTR